MKSTLKLTAFTAIMIFTNAAMLGCTHGQHSPAVGNYPIGQMCTKADDTTTVCVSNPTGTPRFTYVRLDSSGSAVGPITEKNYIALLHNRACMDTAADTFHEAEASESGTHDAASKKALHLMSKSYKAYQAASDTEDKRHSDASKSSWYTYLAATKVCDENFKKEMP